MSNDTSPVKEAIGAFGKDQSQLVERLQREKEQLQKAAEASKRTFAIEMKQAKLKAKEMFEEMLGQRMEGAKKAY